MDKQASELMEKLFVKWQAEIGRRATLDEFAAHIGISRPYVSILMAGKVSPSANVIEKLAVKFGPEVYDELGLPRPDPILKFVTRNWDQLSPSAQNEIKELIDQYLKKTNPGSQAQAPDPN